MQTQEKSQTSERARWSVLSSAGLFCVTAGALILAAAIAIFGLDPEGEFPILFGAAAITLVAGILVLRFGAWAKFVGIVASVVSVMMLFWTAFSLGSFPSFFDFMPALLVVPGALLALGCSVAALVAGRRGHRTAKPDGRERSTLRVMVAVIGVAAITCATLTGIQRDTASATGTVAKAQLKSFHFDRATYTVRGGSRVFVRNDDPFIHTFTIDALDIDQKTTAGGKYVVTIPDKPGSYILYCKLHTGDKEHPTPDDMAARLVVE